MPDKVNCTGPGVFTIKNDCKHYIKCDTLDPLLSIYSGKRLKCPEGQNFNPNTLKCERNCKCFVEKPICVKEGYFANKYGCEYYYQCIEVRPKTFELFEYECPGILVFDEVRQHCDFPENVKGCELVNNNWDKVVNNYKDVSLVI